MSLNEGFTVFMSIGMLHFGAISIYRYLISIPYDVSRNIVQSSRSFIRDPLESASHHPRSLEYDIIDLGIFTPTCRQM